MRDLPQPQPEPPEVPAPEDVAFPGTIRLLVDATDLHRRIFRAREIIPAAATGPMTLLYPKWLPGYHSPDAPIELFTGLMISAGGERLRWKRHPVEVHAFHIDVPRGARTIEAEFQFVSPTDPSQGRIVVTQEMLNLEWNTVVLYPAGHFARRIEVEAAVRLPEGWKIGCALEPASVDGAVTTFRPVSLDVLVDSPLFAGRHFRRIELDAEGAVRLNIVADRADLLDATLDQIECHRALVTQADKLFGARHFDHYDFLLALSDEFGSFGVEHQRSCEIGTIPGYFAEWEATSAKRDGVAHEYTHSWNGKFRRGADSWSPSFDRPIRNSLMWVYEGQTQYWGFVLAARSGLWSTQQALEALAQSAASRDIREGRRWRPMSDTTRDPIIASRSPLPWESWQRSEDYYSEGQLVWLDVDTRIRELSRDRRSLDDFARLFFGMEDGNQITHTYDFDEVARTLDAVVPFDWAGFLLERIEGTGSGAPLEGLERGGYRLVFRDRPSGFCKSLEKVLRAVNLMFSLGLTLSPDGSLKEVIWESPAFEAGLTVGSELLAVNDRAYTEDELKRAITAARDGTPIELLVRSGKRHRMVAIDYRDGLRYPHLDPIEGRRQRLDEIFAPR